MLRVLRKKKFKQDVERARRRKRNMNKLRNVIEHLAKQNPLSARYKVHALRGEFSNCMECHIEPDWLLIYYIENDRLVLIRTGSHADLF
jgi:mRNA interferase YafQ